MAEKQLAKKAFLLQFLTDTLDEVKKADSDSDVATIQSKYAAVEMCFPSMVDIFDELNLLVYNKKKGVPDQTADYAEALNMFGEIKAIHKKFEQDQASHLSNPEKPAPAQVKLPPIEIQSFNGDPTSWKLFKESFQSLILSNHQLTSTQKVQYLVSKLHDTLQQM
ncbi:hypothetical protein WDU94_001917 [Cyamophila willieti]